jgi:hypothetical protein
MPSSPSPFTFGIHPFSIVGMPTGLARGAPDDLPRLPKIIDDLRGPKKLLLRTYIPFSSEASIPVALSILQMVAATRAPWDVVLLFKFDGDDLTAWLDLIRLIVTQFGKSLDTLQITGEPNLRNMPDAGDGSRPHILRALRDGILTAKSTARATAATVSIGFNAVPHLHGSDDFWPAIANFGNDFIESLDYIGLDFYPDVFGPPIPPDHLPAAVKSILQSFRTRDLATAKISMTTPIRITENGWPTSSTRPYDRQATAMESIIRTTHSLRTELNITHYELFTLRDADSSNDNSFYQFGIMRDDYTPKPAFEIYKRLIQELGS